MHYVVDGGDVEAAGGDVRGEEDGVGVRFEAGYAEFEENVYYG